MIIVLLTSHKLILEEGLIPVLDTDEETKTKWLRNFTVVTQRGGARVKFELSMAPEPNLFFLHLYWYMSLLVYVALLIPYI